MPCRFPHAAFRMRRTILCSVVLLYWWQGVDSNHHFRLNDGVLIRRPRQYTPTRMDSHHRPPPYLAVLYYLSYRSFCSNCEAFRGKSARSGAFLRLSRPLSDLSVLSHLHNTPKRLVVNEKNGKIRDPPRFDEVRLKLEKKKGQAEAVALVPGHLLTST